VKRLLPERSPSGRSRAAKALARHRRSAWSAEGAVDRKWHPGDIAADVGPCPPADAGAHVAGVEGAGAIAV